MQAIAREFNLSETTFIERRPAAVERAEGVRVRIFTTQEELNFAGHPTLGTASVLKMLAPETVRDDTVTLALNVGADAGAICAELRARLGGNLRRDDAARSGVWRGTGPGRRGPADGTGRRTILIPRCRRRWSRRERPLPLWRCDSEALGAAQGESGGGDGVAARARREVVLCARRQRRTRTSTARSAGRARMQFNGGEDPATGSAAGCAIAYLVARGAVAVGHAHSCAPGRGDRQAERSFSFRATRKSRG